MASAEYESKMHVSFDDRMYICTLSSLAFADYLVLNIVPGRYVLYEHCGGYIMANIKHKKKQHNRSLVKVANVRDGDGGMYGTYHEGGTENRDALRMLKTYFFDEMDPSLVENLLSEDIEDFDDEDYEGEDGISLLCIPDYNNIPVLFYLNMQLAVTDLPKVLLDIIIREDDVVVWTVRVAGVDAPVGYAVLQPHGFHDMMGDQCGVAIHGFLEKTGSDDDKVGDEATARAYAAGNYDVMSLPESVLDVVVYPRYETALTKSIIVKL